MKIFSNPNIQKAVGAYKSKMTKVEKSKNSTESKDKIEISQGARDFQVAMSAYKNLPDVRQEKIDEVSKSIASGNYNPSSEEIVDQITSGVNFNQKV